jgi:DNA helicase TIP49 (TBP-interacting protein)
MKNLTALIVAALLVLAIGGQARAELTVKTVASDKEKPHVTKERYTTAMATIEAVDLDNRVVTLKGSMGKVFDVKVGPAVKNLDKLKKGDLVTVKYSEAVSAKVYKAGEAPKVMEESASLERAKAGEMPGGKIERQATVTATIESIDMKKPTVTLKTVEGKSLTVKIEDPKLLANVKVGDEVVISYKEAIAISVTKATKKSKK